MIVVIGNPRRVFGSEPGVGGTPALAAIAAVRAGAKVELVGKLGDDAPGDEVVIALGRQGVGHAALLRDPGHRTRVETVAATDEPAPFGEETDSREMSAPEPVEASDSPVLEPEDVQLALRYLPDIRAIVVAEPLPEDVLAAVREAASYVAAPIVVVADAASSREVDLVLAAPPTDPDGAFAELLGQVGAAIDRGVAVDEAFREVSATLGVTPVSP